jgi:hypothetical protein
MWPNMIEAIMLCNTARRQDSRPRASLCSFLFRKEGSMHSKKTLSTVVVDGS